MWYLHTDCSSKKWGSHRLPRLGQKNGFHDILKAQCHDVATAVLNHCNGSVHENVQGYDESHLKESCDHQFEMAVPLTWKTALFNDVPSFEVKPFFLTTIHISENPRLRCKVDASTVRKPDVKAQAIPSYVGWGAGMEMWTFPLIGSILNILNLFFYYASLFGYGILWALNPWYLGIGLFEKNQDINFEKLTCQLLAHSNATPQLKPECFALQDKNLIGLKKKELPQFLSIMCTFRFYSTNCCFEKVENTI